MAGKGSGGNGGDKGKGDEALDKRTESTKGHGHLRDTEAGTKRGSNGDEGGKR